MARGLNIKFIKRTANVWRHHYSVSLTDEEATRIIDNVTDFFDLLLEWEMKTDENTGAGQI